MKLVIAGTRNAVITPNDIFYKFHDIFGFGEQGEAWPEHVLHGNSGNVDNAAQTLWCRSSSTLVTPYTADWKGEGRAAGPIRNAKMAEDGDVLLAFWDGKSRGTLDMITKMTQVGKPTHIIPVEVG